MQGPKALITGASEGIGRALAFALADDGYNIMAVARNEARLQELMKELGGESHQYCLADLAQGAGIKTVADLLLQDQYDVLVNNAGFGMYSHFTGKSVEKHLEMVRVNCSALLTLSHAFLTQAKPGNALINVSSNIAFLPMPASSTYSASKAFVTALSETLWYEQKNRGVYVMNLCPGLTKTEFSDRAGGRIGRQPPEFMYETAEQVAANCMKELVKRRRPTVISGRLNQFLAFLSRILPRKTVVTIMGTVES